MKFLSPIELENFSKQGFVTIDNWLSPPQLKNLHFEFDELFRSGAFKKAQISSEPTKQNLTHNTTRSDWAFWLGTQLPLALDMVHLVLKQWVPLLNKNFYCGVTNFEAHLAHYPEGLGYEKHWDQPKGKENRKLSLVLYLNPMWNPENGGELVLYGADGHSLIEKISPLGGRLVLFRSDLFPHEVKPSLRPRRSLTGWYRNDAV